MTQTVDQYSVEQMAVPTAGAVLPSVPKHHRTRPQFEVRRHVLIAAITVVGTFLCLSAYDRLVTSLMHSQRQRHLASQIGAGLAHIHTGQAFGYVQIPSLGVNEIVVEGVNGTTLRSGPAVTGASVLPGQQGAVVIFGHRSTYGGPFARLSSLKKGDSIFVEARNKAPVIEYRVDGLYRQPDGATSPRPQGASGTSTLVLVTSGNDSLSDARIIVTATAAATVAGGDKSPSDISLATDSDNSPIGFNLVLANLTLGLAILVWKLLQTRQKSTMNYLVVAPIAAVAFIWFAQFAESLLPLTR